MSPSMVRIGVGLVVLALVLPSVQRAAGGGGDDDDGGGGGDSALADTPTGAAQSLYNSNIDDVRLIQLASFDDAFPTLDLYDVYDHVRHPPIKHRMVWNPTTDTGYDFTMEFHTLLTLTTAVITSASVAVKYAKAFAESANVEIEPLRVIVNATDSTRLNLTVADPAASLNGTAWRATLSTWAEAQGVFANWTVQFAVNNVQHGKWRVQGTGVGPWYFDLHGENSYTGVLVHNAYSSTGNHVRALYNDSASPRSILQDWNHLNAAALTATPTNHTNYDNSWWKVYYPTSYPWQSGDPVLMDGGALGRGGVSAYENETWRNRNPAASACYNDPNPNPDHFGFQSGDPDCRLRIVLHDETKHLAPYYVDVASAEQNPEVTVYAQGFYKAGLHSVGLYTNPTLHTNISIARTLMSHEHVHSLQATRTSVQNTLPGIMPKWGHWVEGQATVIAAVANPDVENHSTSLLAKAFNQYQNTNSGIDNGICEPLSYEKTLFWAVFYEKNGGMKAYHRVMKDMYNKAANNSYQTFSEKAPETCRAWTPETITTSLGYLNGTHSNFNDTHRDMAIAAYSRNISFGPPNGTVRQWGHLMQPLVYDNRSIGADANYTTPPLGGAYVKVATTGDFNVTVSVPVNNRWKPLMMQRCDDDTIIATSFAAGTTTAFESRECAGSENVLAVLHPYRVEEIAWVSLDP